MYFTEFFSHFIHFLPEFDTIHTFTITELTVISLLMKGISFPL